MLLEVPDRDPPPHTLYSTAKAYTGLVNLWWTYYVGSNSEWRDCAGTRLIGDEVHAEEGTSFGEHSWQEDCGGIEVVGNETSSESFRQFVVASCMWAFWLAFIASTTGQSPKKVGAALGARFTCRLAPLSL